MRSPKAQPSRQHKRISSFVRRVAGRLLVAGPDAAVVAVVPAVIGKFDQSPDIDFVSESLGAHFPGRLIKDVSIFFGLMTKELFQKPAKLLIGEVPRVGQTSDQAGEYVLKTLWMYPLGIMSYLCSFPRIGRNF